MYFRLQGFTVKRKKSKVHFTLGDGAITKLQCYQTLKKLPNQSEQTKLSLGKYDGLAALPNDKF